MVLAGKVALVTGASRGIGRAIAQQLATAGADVIGTATTAAGADTITTALQQAGGKGQGMVLNVVDDEALKTTVANIQQQVGHIDILVNNAGITRDNLMLRMQDQEWLDVINTNLNAVYKLTKLCLKGMLKARWGRIINISSVVASSGNPGQANYVAAKAGLIGFSKALALEVATRNITVNVVAPGFIATDMTAKLTEQQQDMLKAKIPMQRIGDVAEIAAVVDFLASPAASYITGQTLHVNGGMYMN